LKPQSFDVAKRHELGENKVVANKEEDEDIPF
jgi:hypothetical protein